MEKKLTHELRFWVEKWKKTIKEKGFFNEDTMKLLRDNNLILINEGYKREAFAQKFRIEKEFKLEKNFFKNKKILEVGPGAVQFLEICDAKFSIGVDPLSNKFKELKMINNLNEDTIYLNCNAENIPLTDYSFDVVVSRNCLDHTYNPKKVISEMSRLLREGGFFLLSTDINHEPTKTEPLVLKKKEILDWVEKAKIKILFIEMDYKTHNLKKGKKIIIKGVKND